MPTTRPQLPRDFYLVAIANFVFFLDFSVFFLLPIHLTQLGATEEAIGYVMGTAGVAGLCVMPFLGALLDQHDRRPFVLLGTLGMALASFAYVAVEAVGPLLFVLRVVQGVSFTVTFVTASTLVADLAPLERRGQAIGIFGVSTLTTHAIAPALGEVLAHALGFTVLFVIAGCLGLVSLAIVALVRPAGTHHLAHPLAARPLRREPTMWLAAATMVACGMGFGAVLTFVPTFVHAIAIERVAPFFLAFTSAAITVRTTLGGLSDRVGRRRVLLPSVILFGLAILALGWVQSVPQLVAAGLLFGAGQGMIYPTANALVVDLSHAGNRGRAQTVFAGSFSIGIAASAFVFGGVIERFGYPTMFASAAACVGIAIVLLWLVPEDATIVSAALEPGGEIG